MSAPARVKNPLRTVFLAVCLALWALLIGSAPAQVQPQDFIIIGPGGGRQLPLAVDAFRNLGSQEAASPLGLKISQVISEDLKATGLFRLLDPVSFLEDPLGGALIPEEIDFRNWSAIGAEALIKGGFRLEGDRLEVEARLFVVVRSSMVVGKKYVGRPDDFRRIAHSFANEVVRFFTGEPGTFDGQIAFVSSRQGVKEISLMDYDGFSSRQITRNGSINLKPAWSPDGQKLAYTSYQQRQPAIYVADLIRGGSRRLPLDADMATGAVWSPDGALMAVALSRRGNTDLYLLHGDGRLLRRLTEHFAIDVDPAWSPDGKTLAFTSNRSGSPQIYLMDANGQNIRRLTFEGRYNSSPVWSPKGDLIAFNGTVDGEFKLSVIRPDGTGLRRVTSAPGKQTDPSWSPDGRFLAFTSSGGREEKHVALLNVATGWLKRLGKGETPSWSPRVQRTGEK
ncbi:MAG: Tol-Pal system beta propeller repeat protein TolB [Candidatus Tectomicrobia bacterium]|nr:Tol-Pal system beta propeller repeat protein TolB [Candidatus Tectomicrobia bacterium]